MCIAVPGRVVRIDGTRGTVDVKGNSVAVEMGLVKAGVGDYVLVHAGCAISVVAQDEAEEIQALMDLVDGYAGE